MSCLYSSMSALREIALLSELIPDDADSESTSDLCDIMSGLTLLSPKVLKFSTFSVLNFTLTTLGLGLIIEDCATVSLPCLYYA